MQLCQPRESPKLGFLKQIHHISHVTMFLLVSGLIQFPSNLSRRDVMNACSSLNSYHQDCHPLSIQKDTEVVWPQDSKRQLVK